AGGHPRRASTPARRNSRQGGRGGARRSGFLGGEELDQPLREDRRRRLVLVPEVDVRRRAEPLRERAKVLLGIRRLPHPDVAERLGVEVVDANDAVDAVPRLVPEVVSDLEPWWQRALQDRQQAVVAGALNGDSQRGGPVAESLDELDKRGDAVEAGQRHLDRERE